MDIHIIMIMSLLLIMLAAPCIPVQAEETSTVQVETVEVVASQSAAGKSVAFKNTKGKNLRN